MDRIHTIKIQYQDNGKIYTAKIQKDGEWWMGEIQEITGINCKERTKEELLEVLELEALKYDLDILPNDPDAEAWDKAPAIFASLAAALGVASLLSATLATFPRTKGPKDSFIYFGGIAERTLDQFRESVSTMTSDSYVSDLAAQCHRNAEIATAKFLWVQRALCCLYLSVPPWALALWLLYARTVQ